MSTEFLRRAGRIPASPDPDRATVQTIQEMVRLIDLAADDPLVYAFAAEGVDTWRGGLDFAASGRDPWTDAVAIAESCFWQAKHYMRFVHHSQQIFVLFHERDQMQLLIAPDVLLRMRDMEGDCAIYTMLVCAMLQALGVRYEIQTLAVNPYQPDVFTHVFLRVVTPKGRRVPLDASHGKFMGWMVPQQDILRSQVWNEDGQPVEDAQQFDGLHGYHAKPNPWWSSGFGQVDTTDLTPVDTGSGIDESTIQQLPSGSTLSDLGVQSTLPMGPTALPGIQTTVVGSSSGYVAPSQSDAAWAAFASQLAKSGMTLAEIQTIQPGTVVGANGAILRQAPGFAVPSSGVSASLSSITSSPMLLVGLVAVGALALFSKK